MARPDVTAVKTVASLGGGPIGAGWAAHFLARGYDVKAYLHAMSEEAMFRKILDTAWASLTELGLAPGASRDRLTLTDRIEEAVADIGFVQESAPERLELKQRLYETLGRIVPADVVIASSTSGLMMTDIQALCPTPERTVIGHPFNPPYLLPLVEIIGGIRQCAQRLGQRPEEVIPVDQRHPSDPENSHGLVPVLLDVSLRLHTQLTDTEVGDLGLPT